jgi:hypothetical protein
VTGGEPPQIPDLWVLVVKLAWWIRHVFGLEGGDLIRYVVLALRRGPHLRIVWPHGAEIIQSWDWDKIPRRNSTVEVTVNWEAGYIEISEPNDLDNPLVRYPIEAEWEVVIRAVSDWQQQQRRAEARAARALALAQKPAPAPEESPTPLVPPVPDIPAPSVLTAPAPAVQSSAPAEEAAAAESAQPQPASSPLLPKPKLARRRAKDIELPPQGADWTTAVRTLGVAMKEKKLQAYKKDLVTGFETKFGCSKEQAEWLWRALPQEIHLGKGGQSAARKQQEAAGKAYVMEWAGSKKTPGEEVVE